MPAKPKLPKGEAAKAANPEPFRGEVTDVKVHPYRIPESWLRAHRVFGTPLPERPPK